MAGEADQAVATGEADRAVAAGGADRTGAVADQEAVVLVLVAGEDCRESVATEMAVVSRETGISRPQLAQIVCHESEGMGTVEC